MNITVIAVGKLKENYFISACGEYARRLSPYCRLEIIELNERSLPGEPSEAQIAAALSKEAESIRRKIPAGALVAALCIEGDMLSSEELAAAIERAKVSGRSAIAFIIGGSYGLAPDIKKQADIRLSMSRMTFPHHLARVMLLEQLYRASKINEGGKYHK